MKTLVGRVPFFMYNPPSITRVFGQTAPSHAEHYSIQPPFGARIGNLKLEKRVR